jgi:hypothetical protein
VRSEEESEKERIKTGRMRGGKEMKEGRREEAEEERKKKKRRGLDKIGP